MKFKKKKVLIKIQIKYTYQIKNQFKVKIIYLVTIDDLYNEGDYEIAKQYAE